MAVSLTPPRANRHRRLIGLVLSGVGIVAAIVLFASPFLIQSISMTSTIQPGQFVLVDRVGTSLGLQRGEVILFYPPDHISSTPFIKRVIGLPGDRVVISGGHVSVNGATIAESYLAAGTKTFTANKGYDAVTVPPGSVFVLGDDRTASWDSRYFGPVSDGSIVGRAWVILTPGSLSFAML